MTTLTPEQRDGLGKIADELDRVAERNVSDPIIVASLGVDAKWLRTLATAEPGEDGLRAAIAWFLDNNPNAEAADLLDGVRDLLIEYRAPVVDAGLDVRLREFAESVAVQFGYWTDGIGGLSAGGLSTLEEAWAILGWDDPQPRPESCCQWPQGCKKRGDAGTPVAETHPVYGGMRYVWTCWEHSPEYLRRLAATEPKEGA